MSSQDTAAPKRRSAAANRRRKRRADATAGQASSAQRVATGQPESQPVDADVVAAKPTRAERKAEAKEAPASASADALPKEKHLRRKHERRQAKSQQPDKKSGFGRMVNTDRFAGIQGFSRDTMAEIRKVIWPDREATRNLTILVIALSTILGLLLGGLDYVLFRIFEAMS